MVTKTCSYRFDDVTRSLLAALSRNEGKNHTDYLKDLLKREASLYLDDEELLQIFTRENEAV